MKQLTPMERIERAWPYLSPWQQFTFAARILGAAIFHQARQRLAVVRVGVRNG